MCAARIAATVLLCFALPACGMFEKRKETTEAPKHIPPHLANQPDTPAPLPSGPVAMAQPYPIASPDSLYREEAQRDYQMRQLAGTAANNLSWENGTVTTNKKFVDGSYTSTGSPAGPR